MDPCDPFMTGKRRVFQHILNRNRKLCNTSKIWPTFTGAVHWMRDKQTTIETALSILEVHPNLVQHRCMDKFRAFIYPFLPPCQTNLNKHSIPSVGGNDMSDVESKKKSETQRQHREGSNYTRMKCVYICRHRSVGRSTDIERISTELSTVFYVHCGPNMANGSGLTVSLGDIQFDAFIFIITNESLHDQACLMLLKNAISSDASVHFLKVKDTMLPDNLQASLLESTVRLLGGSNNLSHKPVSLKPNHSNKNNESNLKRSSAIGQSYLSQDISKTVNFVRILLNGCKNAILYDPNSHHDCIGIVVKAVNDTKSKEVELVTRTSPLLDLSKNLLRGSPVETNTNADNYSIKQKPAEVIQCPGSLTDNSRSKRDMKIPTSICFGENRLNKRNKSRQTNYLICSGRGKCYSYSSVLKPCILSGSDNMGSGTPIGFHEVDLTIKPNTDRSSDDEF